MSEGAVRAAIEQMEAWLAEPSWLAEPEELARWNAEFQAALARAEKGPAWPELVARAHALGKQLEERAAAFAQIRDALKQELDTQARGNRALKGYRPSSL